MFRLWCCFAAAGAALACSKAQTYAQHCAAPRPGTNDVQGTATDEKRWLRSWTNGLYLWYDEVSYGNPDDAAQSVLDYFNTLRTTALTASGKPKDQFHFTYSTADWEALSQSGVQAGYGVQWVVVHPTPPREVVAAYVEVSSPAHTANIARGATVLSVDGEDCVNGSDVDTINAGLFPSGPNESHTIVFQNVGGPTTSATLTSANVTETPVRNVESIPTADGSAVGYVLFNDHIATAEAELVSAIETLKSEHVSDLVLDIRYNGGGILDLASELAYMIAGPTATGGKTFERTVFNNKYPNSNPITGGQVVTGFHNVTQAGQALPYLGLRRLYVLTQASTCSASESIMNSLRGVDVQVIQVGGTTCGKPYGFYPQDNCGTTYFSIEFQGVNEKGFGDYADGFTPGGAGAAGLPGCPVADDFTHELGDINESMLSAALEYRASGNCPSATGRSLAQLRPAASGIAIKPPWLENRIMRR